MAAIAPEAPALNLNLPRDRYLHQLSPTQQDLHCALMELLGYEGGAATTDGGLTDQSERLAVAQEAAANARIALPTGSEIAECNDCGLLFDANQAHEADGLVRCEEHHGAWALANDDNYGRTDTTFESRWD
ncbi:hypothetical protein [Streptomyces sp. AC1-42T]|uniref:hypothetical protein n=1 Tax=Streptomyces sp. AC1-42T TaxID=2218665 RepID=UPI000DAE0686|nr:hypothetical protein [Streptomyces sp. AC1-42T]PZT71430.1 hypothetical protein DNK55_32470 [Streptomyces sp. AC1-42T]